MAVTMLYDAGIYYGSTDLSADHNTVKVEMKADALENTVFGATTHTFQPGRKSIDVSSEGFVQFDASSTPKKVDDILFAEIGAATPKILTVSAAKADGSRAWLLTAPAVNYGWSLTGSDLGKFNFSAACGARNFAYGILALPLSSRSGASGNGTITQLGALSATQKLIANLHVTAFNGTTMSAIVYSNDTNDTTTPTSRIAFTAATGVTSEGKEVSGAITDTYWYVGWTFTGTSFSAVVSVGIV